MQILPANLIECAKDLLQGSEPASSQDNSFSQVLDQAAQASANLDQDEPKDSYPYLADSPYSAEPEFFSPFVPQEVRLTVNEASRLTQALREDGVTDVRVLNAIGDMSAIPGGATLEQLLGAAFKAMEGERNILSKQEKEQLAALLGKLGGDKGQELYRAFLNGTDSKALDSLLEQLKNMPGSVNLTRNDMALLAKALNLPEGVTRNLLAEFKGQTELNLPGQQLAEILAAADAELTSRQGRKDTLLDALGQQAQTVLKDASAREEAERMAMLGEDKTVAQTKLLIQDTATQAMFGREAQADQSKQTRNVGKNSEFANPAVKAEPIDQAQNQAPVNHLTGKNLHSETEAEPKSGTEQKEFAWQSSHDAKTQAQAENLVKNDSPQSGGQVYAAVASGVGNFNPVAAAQPQAVQNQLPPQTMEQIEQAILTASKNGAQRLEVALNPVELGAITVVLTSKNGELSALILSEKAETSSLLQQQMDQIRTELENQGFKIDKIDVQTQLADSRHDWQGPEQHNSWREMNDRLENMERLRRMSRGVDLGLAQPVQTVGQTAINSGNGLHLVA